MNDNRYHIPAVAKTTRALTLLAERSQRWTVSALARELGMSRTTCFRMLQTLVDAHLVSCDDQRYGLGVGLVRLGLQALGHVPLRQPAVAILREITARTHETSHLAIRCADRSLLLEVSDAPQATRVASRPGTLVYLHASATGKVLLAGMSETARAALAASLEFPALTTHTVANAAALEVAVQRTQADGYGRDDEEYHLGVRCVAVPVHDQAGAVIAALGITSSPTRLTAATMPDVVAQLREAARALSASVITPSRISP